MRLLKADEIEWRPVVGYEGLYEVSNTGCIRGLDRTKNNVHTTPKILKASTSQRYSYVKLYKNNSHRSLKVHRIVAEAFVPNPYGKPQVNHIDGNKLNNNASNLEWCTQAENNRHAIDTGLQNPCHMIDATRKKVIQLSKKGEFIREWMSITEASNALGLQVSNISHCCKNRIRSTGGFVWRFKEDC